MPSVFSKIVNKEISCFKVYEDKKHLAFLDISPNTKGKGLLGKKKGDKAIIPVPSGKIELEILKITR